MVLSATDPERVSTSDYRDAAAATDLEQIASGPVAKELSLGQLLGLTPTVCKVQGWR